MGKVRLKWKPHRKIGNVGQGIPNLSSVVCPNWIRQQEPVKLRQTFQDLARDNIKAPKAWDAYMFRVGQLRDRFTANDVSLLFDALATAKRSVPAFMQMLVEIARAKVFQMSVRDSAILLNALAKLKSHQPELAGAMQANILQKLRDHCQDRDLALLAFTYARAGGRARRRACSGPHRRRVDAAHPPLQERAEFVSASPRLRENNSLSFIIIIIIIYRS